MGVEIPEPIINDAVLAHNFTNEGGVGNTIRLLKNITGLFLVQECRGQWQRAGEDYSWADLMAQAERRRAVPQPASIPDAPDFLNPSNMIEAIQDFCRAATSPCPRAWARSSAAVWRAWPCATVRWPSHWRR